jgi:hypothetical protein
MFQHLIHVYCCFFEKNIFDLICCFHLGFSRQTFLARIDLEGNSADMNYSPGDHVAIFPLNSPELVDGIISRLHNAPPANPRVNSGQNLWSKCQYFIIPKIIKKKKYIKLNT